MVFKDRFMWVRVVCSTGQPCMVMNPLLSQRRKSKFSLGAAVARKRVRNQIRRAQKRRNLTNMLTALCLCLILRILKRVLKVLKFSFNFILNSVKVILFTHLNLLIREILGSLME